MICAFERKPVPERFLFLEKALKERGVSWGHKFYDFGNDLDFMVKVNRQRFALRFKDYEKCGIDESDVIAQLDNKIAEAKSHPVEAPAAPAMPEKPKPPTKIIVLKGNITFNSLDQHAARFTLGQCADMPILSRLDLQLPPDALCPGFESFHHEMEGEYTFVIKSKEKGEDTDAVRIRDAEGQGETQGQGQAEGEVVSEAERRWADEIDNTIVEAATGKIKTSKLSVMIQKARQIGNTGAKEPTYHEQLEKDEDFI